ncbi:MAG: hypothetical protein WBZ15_11215, partial [Mycobacterium sp.]|uniref:hypothetical protein n=1 Tax=Mycobacterium sp. TaxID=1785 RepID=UPI003C5ADBF1
VKTVRICGHDDASFGGRWDDPGADTATPPMVPWRSQARRSRAQRVARPQPTAIGRHQFPPRVELDNYKASYLRM